MYIYICVCVCVCVFVCKVICNVREAAQFSLKGIIYDFIGNLKHNHCFMADFKAESASDPLNEPFNINSALYIKIQNVMKTLLNSTVTRSAV